MPWSRPPAPSSQPPPLPSRRCPRLGDRLAGGAAAASDPGRSSGLGALLAATSIRRSFRPWAWSETPHDGRRQTGRAWRRCCAGRAYVNADGVAVAALAGDRRPPGKARRAAGALTHLAPGRYDIDDLLEALQARPNAPPTRASSGFGALQPGRSATRPSLSATASPAQSASRRGAAAGAAFSSTRPRRLEGDGWSSRTWPSASSGATSFDMRQRAGRAPSPSGAVAS